MNRIVTIAVSAFLALILLSSTTYTVDQRQFAIVFSFGQIKDTILEPGLHFKLPSPFENVIKLDKRIMTYEPNDPDRFITAEKKNILVDAFVKWRIVNPRIFYISFGNDDARVKARLGQIVKAALNDEITKRTVREVISGERNNVMQAMRAKVDKEAGLVGIQIIDARLKHVDYVEQINNSVYERMKSERVKFANELRSTGSADSEKIRADADRQRTVILAEAYRDAEKMRGEGDAKASQIYAAAFGKNAEFYKFYRSLEAYRATFRTHNDVMVVDSNSDFFKYFKNSGSATKK